MREKVETLANFKHMLVGLLLGLPLVRFQSIQKKIASKSSCLDADRARLFVLVPLRPSWYLNLQ